MINDDAISRQAVLDLINADWKYEGLETDVASLPPVIPQLKTGHWIEDGYGVACSECDKWYPHAPIAINEIKYCCECGAKMVESQERSEEIEK